MGIRAILLIVALALAPVACSKDGGSPEGPIEPPPPDIGANIVATGSLTFGLCTGPDSGCSYSQEYGNTGPGCANNLRGKIRVYQEETLLETDDWWLDSTVLIRPGESIPVEDCCFHQDTVRLSTRSVAETFWNDVPCS